MSYNLRSLILGLIGIHKIFGVRVSIDFAMEVGALFSLGQNMPENGQLNELLSWVSRLMQKYERMASKMAKFVGPLFRVLVLNGNASKCPFY